MLTKNRISDIKKLSQKKFREERGVFIVEGTKSVLDLLNSQLVVKEIFTIDSWFKEHAMAIPGNVVVEIVKESELARITCLKTAQDVLAIAQCPVFDIANIDVRQPVLLLDGIRDPGNLGTIIRTADWFGFRQIVCSPDCVEFTNPKVVQATMGSFSRMQIYYTDLSVFLEKNGKNRTVYGTFMEGTDIAKVDFCATDYLVIGSEGSGISDKILPFIDEKIHIPSFAHSLQKAESLNVSIATAVVLYQFCNHIINHKNE